MDRKIKDFRDLRIVFMGTPEFAVASLAKLVEAGCTIAGVVTAPDKPAGRGLEISESAVKKYAVQKGLQVLQPQKLRSPEFLEQLRSLNADLQVVVAFRMLPEVVWSMPRLGTINVHGSLLPQYRGAAPINWAIINGEKFTGVTTFKLKHDIDTGDILLQERIDISETETAGELHDKMKEAGAALLLRTVKELCTNNLREIPQEKAAETAAIPLKHAPKIFTETCQVNWNKNAGEVYDLIRGLSPYPAAFTKLHSKFLKIYKADKKITPVAVEPGNYETDGKTYLRFACKNGYMYIKELQLEGKKRMPVEDFLRGYHFQ